MGVMRFQLQWTGPTIPAALAVCRRLQSQLLLTYAVCACYPSRNSDINDAMGLGVLRNSGIN